MQPNETGGKNVAEKDKEIQNDTLTTRGSSAASATGISRDHGIEDFPELQPPRKEPYKGEHM